jgi:alginate O-acetyltransferase complex protein AlgI
MLFNSIDFALFLPVVFIIYWLLGNVRFGVQNAFIVLASYFFYGWWDWRFLLLIVFSTLVDYTVGVKMGQEERESRRKVLLWTSILVNLGLLGFFKYFNFFVANFNAAFTLFGQDLRLSSLQIILPVGISFYTFQTLSYTIDVYNRRLRPTHDLVIFSAYVSFFPQLVAGPIERATQLMPQFLRKRVFNYEQATDGMRQILWGLFKKVVIADSCAVYVNQIFADPSIHSGSTLLLGAVLFAFQIYGDFSGYSDIAIGTGRLFGFNLMRNFAYPYFSRDIAEFWRRWHISLSTWFRDYVYIPLGGSRVGTLKTVRNVFVIFVVSGFWHGASWTFIIWGALNALYFLPLMLLKNNRANLDTVARGRLLPSVKELGQMLLTFSLTCFAWIFFRAQNTGEAVIYLKGIIDVSLFQIPELQSVSLLFLILFMIMIEWIQCENQHGMELSTAPRFRVLRWSSYLALSIIILSHFGEANTFIYFQF